MLTATDNRTRTDQDRLKDAILRHITYSLVTTPAELSPREAFQAVALAAGGLFRAPTWDEGIEGVLEQLGRAAQASRAYICENVQDALRRAEEVYEGLEQKFVLAKN